MNTIKLLTFEYLIHNEHRLQHTHRRQASFHIHVNTMSIALMLINKSFIHIANVIHIMALFMKVLCCISNKPSHGLMNSCYKANLHIYIFDFIPCSARWYRTISLCDYLCEQIRKLLDSITHSLNKSFIHHPPLVVANRTIVSFATILRY